MWVADYVIAIIERFDRCTDAFIRKIHGHQLARNLSVGMDRFYRESTLLVDRVCLGTRATHGYDPAATNADEEAASNNASGQGPSVAQARKFRRKYVKPRRRLARRADGGLRWEQLAAGRRLLTFLSPFAVLPVFLFFRTILDALQRAFPIRIGPLFFFF